MTLNFIWGDFLFKVCYYIDFLVSSTTGLFFVALLTLDHFEVSFHLGFPCLSLPCSLAHACSHTPVWSSSLNICECWAVIGIPRGEFFPFHSSTSSNEEKL